LVALVRLREGSRSNNDLDQRKDAGAASVDDVDAGGDLGDEAAKVEAERDTGNDPEAKVDDGAADGQNEVEEKLDFGLDDEQNIWRKTIVSEGSYCDS
jgi:hypothetical protein